MDNTTPLPPICVIKLDQHQYAFYKKNRLQIHSPTGQAITVLSKQLPVITDEDAIYQLYCEAHVLEKLFDEVNERFTLMAHRLDRRERNGGSMLQRCCIPQLKHHRHIEIALRHH